MSGPALVRDLGNGWSLRRWEYDGAKLEAHRPADQLRDEIVVTGPDVDGDILVEIDTREYTISAYVPAAALRAMLGLDP